MYLYQRKKTQTQKQKENYFFAEGLVGPSAKNGVPSAGRRHMLLCADAQAWRKAKAGQLGFQRGQKGACL
jgi:hypothetical protein